MTTRHVANHGGGLNRLGTRCAGSVWQWLVAAWMGSALALAADSAGMAASRPNILWLTCEDTGPNLGCYGDRYATTPALDALAGRSLRYRRVWSVAPVCAPARTAIISGRYPSSMGAEHMRSDVALPRGVEMFPSRLRQAGYYCSNNSKEDYNLRRPEGVWDESSSRAHWRNRAPGQPFFAVFNYTETHESATRRRPHRFVHDPALAPIPPYMPDTREVREGWAQYYDQIAVMDRRVESALNELAEAGLDGETIVFFFGDHGAGLPRHKRSASDSGLRVPLLVHFPPRWRHLAPKDYCAGGESTRLVSFVDLAPTVWSLAGLDPGSAFDGVAFAGRNAGPERRYLFGERGRMDERHDFVRSVTDGRHVYVRNYLPHLPQGQHVEYLFQTPMTRAWFDLHLAGALTPVQRAYWEPREAEELYDLEQDPHETVNLARNPRHREVLHHLRRVHAQHQTRTGDLGVIPEAERLRPTPGWEKTTDDRRRLRQVTRVASAASGPRGMSEGTLGRHLSDPDPVVRYWGAMAVRMHGAAGSGASVLGRLRDLARSDPSDSVRVAAAEALAVTSDPADQHQARAQLLSLADVRGSDYLVAVSALQALDSLGPVSREARDRLSSLPRIDSRPSARMNDYLGRLLRHLLEEGRAPE